MYEQGSTASEEEIERLFPKLIQSARISCISTVEIQSSLNKLMGLNYLPFNYHKMKAIFASPDERLLPKVTCKPHHVLHQILPPVKSTSRDMRDERTITSKTMYSSYQDKTFSPCLLNTQKARNTQCSLFLS